MEYLRGWRALTGDPDWKRKFLVAMVCLFIPVLGPLVLLGWIALAIRRAVQGQDSPLPELRFDMDYMLKLASLGFRPWIARTLYMLPLMLLFIVVYVVAIVGGVIVGAASHGAASHGASHSGGGDTVGLVMLVAFAAFYLFFLAAAFALSLLANVAVLRAELMDQLGPALRFSEVRAMTRVLLKELIIGHIVLGFIATGLVLLSLATCYIALPPAMTVLFLLLGFFNAELYKAYLAKGGAPLPIGALDIPAGSGGTAVATA